MPSCQCPMARSDSVPNCQCPMARRKWKRMSVEEVSGARGASLQRSISQETVKQPSKRTHKCSNRQNKQTTERTSRKKNGQPPPARTPRPRLVSSFLPSIVLFFSFLRFFHRIFFGSSLLCRELQGVCVIVRRGNYRREEQVPSATEGMDLLRRRVRMR